MVNIKPSIPVVVEGKSRGNGQNEHDKSNLGVKVYSIEILQGGLIKLQKDIRYRGTAGKPPVGWFFFTFKLG